MDSPSFSSSSTMCETSNIRFGKLDIVMQSYNSVPTIQSFYDNTSLVQTTKTRSIKIEEPYTTSKNKGNEKTNGNVYTQVSIVPSLNTSVNNQLLPESTVFCWWCHITPVLVEYACFLPIKYDELRNRYTKHGYFCCWECTKAFNFDIRDIKSRYRSYLINNMSSIVRNISFTYY